MNSKHMLWDISLECNGKTTTRRQHDVKRLVKVLRAQRMFFFLNYPLLDFGILLVFVAQKINLFKTGIKKTKIPKYIFNKYL